MEAALEYKRLGFSVIPVKKDKRPLIPWTEFQKRIPTANEIKQWWKDYPSANVGIVCGEVSNLFAIDCDSEDSFETVKKHIPQDLTYPIASTPRGGRHLLFSYPKGSNLTIAAGVIPNLDFRGNGGFVVAAPSVNDNGKGYAWIVKPTVNNIPPLPEQLLSFLLRRINNIIYSPYIKGNVVNSSSFTTKHYIYYNILQEGKRDNDLFHVANCLLKGNCEPEVAEQVLNILADNCNPPFPKNEIPAKIKSALNRVHARERNLADEVREYFLLQDGYTFIQDILQTLQITTKEEKKNLGVVLTRLVQDGIIEHYGEKRGCYRPITKNLKKMNFIDGPIPEFEVKLPLGLHDLVSIYKKNIIILAGDKSAGKSAMLLNIAHMNQDLHPVVYLSSEMVEEEWSVRLKKWGVKGANEIRYEMVECSGNFHNHIGPEHKIYIVDYLEIQDNFWEVGKFIRKIHDKLQEGICFIALQKKTNQLLGRGAEFSLEKARLYLTLDFMPLDRCSKLTIVDAKAPKLGENVRGYWKKLKIVDAIKLSTDDNTWRTK